MTKWYHIKRSIYSVFILSVILTLYVFSDVSGILFIPIPICTLLFFTNLVTWIEDTEKWNKGTCQFCGSPWLASEGNVYDDEEYHCSCGRVIWF